MPPKMVKCSICGDEVSKRSTRLLENGTRACKSHDGVVEQSEARMAEEKKKRQEKEAARERRFHERHGLNSEGKFDIGPKCFVCYKPGLRQDEFAMRMLIAQKKMQVKGENPFCFSFDHEEQKAHIEKMREALKSPDAKDDRELRCLFVRETPPEGHLFWKKVHRDARMAAQFLKGMLICGACAEELKIDLHKDIEDKAPKMSLKQMAVLGHIFEETVGKTLTAEAVGEVAAEDAANMKGEEE